jgi:DNA (cytosine-5)-methyltransferase 1
MTAYYNEIDPYAAQWLRNLIAAGHIAPGDVDERSIADVRPDDLRRYTQCHFFAGIGVWSYALRRAGWVDERPVWTGSCPCQPFSAAGKGGGFDDERHLWPHFHWLISQCRPGVVLGEQVASKDGLAWLDLVQADLEGTGYASGAVDLCAAGVGAPHIRQRLWWVAERVADADSYGAGNRSGQSVGEKAAFDGADGRLSRERLRLGLESAPGGVDDDDDPRLEGQRSGHRTALGHGQGSVRSASEAGQSGELEDAPGERLEGWPLAGREQSPQSGRLLPHGPGHNAGPDWPGPTNGLWRAADWLRCRDGKWRPVEPGTFPLAHGAPSRVGRLRAYGNAINAEAAVAFIESCLDIETTDCAAERLRLTETSVSSVMIGAFA